MQFRQAKHIDSAEAVEPHRNPTVSSGCGGNRVANCGQLRKV